MLIKYHERYLKHASAIGFLVVTIFALFYAYDYLLQVSISSLLPKLQIQFHLSDIQLGYLGAVFFISYVLTQIPGGLMLDTLGLKVTSIFLAFFCSIGIFIFSISQNLPMLMLARFLIGIGSSCACMCAIYSMARWLPSKYFPPLVALLQSIMAFGCLMGQTPIVYLNKKFTWQQLGSGLFIICLLFLILFTVIIGSTKTKKIHVATSTKKHTLKQSLSVLKNRNLYLLFSLSFISWAPVGSLIGYWYITYLHSTFNITPLAASILIIPFWIGFIVGAPAWNHLSDYLKNRTKMMTLAFGTQLIALLFVIYFSQYSIILMIALFCLGSTASMQGYCFVIAKELFPSTTLGFASSIINSSAGLSSGILQVFIGYCVGHFFLHSQHAYLYSFNAYLIFSIIAILICLTLLPETYPKETH